MGGFRSGVEVEELAEDDAGARAGVLGQREGLDLGEEGVVGVAGDQEGGLLGGSDLGGLRGGGVFAVEETLVGALAELPENHAHDHGGGEKEGEEDGLVTRDHGWRASVFHSRRAAARASATRAW
jgi:hypothetical protein